METLSLMIIALAMMFFAEVLLIWYLHRKIGYYKKLKAQREDWELNPTLQAMEMYLKAIRKFTERHYPEGQPRLDMTTYSLSQYLKHMRWLASKQDEGNENIQRSIEESKLNEIKQ